MSKSASAARWLLPPLVLAGLAAGAMVALRPAALDPWAQFGLAALTIMALPALDFLGRRAFARLRGHEQTRRVVIRINRRR